MLAGLCERIGAAWRRPDEPWFAALAASATAHIALLVVLAFLWVGAGTDRNREAALDTRWQPVESPPPLVDLEPTRSSTTPDADAGGRAAAAMLPATADADLPAIFPTFAATEPADRSAEHVLAAGLAENVGAAPAAADDGHAGRGNGAGDGAGDGGGFFGAPPHGRRFVYVVDRSGSMNHPHDSEAKTRFRRLKMELLSSIGQMTPEMEFYIVFFNENPHPMPARTLQAATPQAKRHFLEWMSRMRAVGRTDPRSALEIALRLEPDTIYFLSDGSFEHRVTRDLRNIRQRRAVIHTFAFGETAGQETLEWVAANNGGKYHFVP